MRRRSLVALLAALMVMAMTLGASAAFAGEVKGPPGPDGAEGGFTPIKSHTANSICSFSGLNDVIEPSEPTQTQSYGTFLVLIKKDAGLQAAKAILPSPGVACNPNGGFEE